MHPGPDQLRRTDALLGDAMSRRLICLVLAGLLVIAAVPAFAALCVPDRAPAATLLYPYFQVRSDASANSTVWVTNTDPTPAVAQLTVWTDGGKAVFSAPMYVAGRQRRALDLAALIFSGTKPDWQAPAARPNLSDALTSFPGCTTAALEGRTLTVAERDRLRRALTGQLNDQSICGFNHGDLEARGYVTVDVRTACGPETPEESAYYAGIGHANVLFGELAVIHSSFNFASSIAAVAIEADTAGGAILAADHSFYGRFSGGGNIDRREPLPTRWSVERGSTVALASRQAIVWRDGPARARLCSGAPPPTIGNSNAPAVVYFDASGTQTPWTRPGVHPLGSALTLATAAIDLDSAFGPLPAAFTRVEMRLQDDPTNSGQSWLGLSVSWEGRFHVQTAASALDGNCRAQTLSVPASGALVTNPTVQVDAFHQVDGFEDGLPHGGIF